MKILGCAFVAVALGCASLGRAAGPADPLTQPTCADFAPRCVPLTLRLEGETYAFNVLLPPAYKTSGRSYPVLYLMHGGAPQNQDRMLGTDIVAFTDHLPDHQQAIVVLPDDGSVPAADDWRGAGPKWETFHTDALVHYIDTNLRTIPSRAFRAVAGFSMGGFIAMHDAARHPDQYVAVGSFSGALEWPAFASPANEAALTGYAVAYSAYCTLLFDADPKELDLCSGIRGGGLQGEWGNAATDPAWFHNADPIDLVPSLGNLSLVYISTGNGIPCGPADVNAALATGVSSVAEPVAYQMTTDFDRALRRASVAHTSHFRSCGIHTLRQISVDIHDFWFRMLAAFGNGEPYSFDYRRVDPQFSMFGWRFVADPRRAPEFLDVSNASCLGVGLSGSGTATVTTASCFAPGRLVALEGAVELNAHADPDGRLTFQVDLGTAHHHEQYTIPEHALELRGGYFHSMEVTFR